MISKTPYLALEFYRSYPDYITSDSPLLLICPIFRISANGTSLLLIIQFPYHPKNNLPLLVYPPSPDHSDSPY